MKALLVASALLLSIQVARADDLLMAKSSHPVAETLDRVEAAAKSDGFFIVARVDHAGAAEGVGLKLRPTALLIFGKPQGGTPLMQCDQRAGIDLPLKALARQDESGQVWLGMVDPAVLRSRYGLGAACVIAGCNRPMPLHRPGSVGMARSQTSRRRNSRPCSDSAAPRSPSRYRRTDRHPWALSQPWRCRNADRSVSRKGSPRPHA